MAAPSPQESAESGEDTGGYVIAGDWIVIGKNEAEAQKVVDATEKASLADDEDYKTWTAAAGDPGIMSMYAAPEAGEYVGRYLGDMAGMGSMFGVPSPDGMEFNPDTGEFEEAVPGESPSIPPELQSALDDFDGAAATVRFDDGGLEVESAYSDYQPDLTKYFNGGSGVEIVEGLPEDTVAAFGLGLDEGWAQAMLDYFVASSGGEMDLDEMLAEAESETGLDLPADLETLFGEGVAVGAGQRHRPRCHRQRRAGRGAARHQDQG